MEVLGTKRILRTKDYGDPAVTRAEIEDLLRKTLVLLAKTNLGWDVSSVAHAQPERPIVDIFTSQVVGFSKLKLARAFLTG